MAEVTLEELRERFDTPTKEIEVKAWGGKVTIKKLTIEEENRVQALLLSDVTPEELEENKINVKIANAQQANLLKASLALVKPKMKPQELGALSPEAMEGVNEIIEALEKWDKPKKSKGKS